MALLLRYFHLRHILTVVLLCATVVTSGCAVAVGALGLGAGYFFGKKTIQTSKQTEQYVDGAERYNAPGVPVRSPRYQNTYDNRAPAPENTQQPYQDKRRAGPAYPPR